jgi:hypothetical protein
MATIPIPIPEPGWDMSDCPPEDMVIAYLVMAVEGSGDDEDGVAVITTEGTLLPILGVRVEDGQVQIVVQP